MVSEVQKYDSTALKNLGFTLLAPFGSILFQAIVFKKSISDSYFYWSIIVAVVGCILIYLGRSIIEEETRG